MINKSTEWEHKVKTVLIQIDEQDKKASLRVLNSISHTDDIVNRYFNTEFISIPISRINYLILRIVIQNGGSMNQTDISQTTTRAKHTITNAVDSLERRGYVKREPVKGDRRVKNVTITMKGLDLVENSFDEWAKISQVVTSCLDEKEQKQFLYYLRKLRNHIMSLKDN